jgi:hypothetical protein
VRSGFVQVGKEQKRTYHCVKVDNPDINMPVPSVVSSSAGEQHTTADNATEQPRAHHMWDNLTHHHHQAKPEGRFSEPTASEHKQLLKVPVAECPAVAVRSTLYDLEFLDRKQTTKSQLHGWSKVVPSEVRLAPESGL